MVIDKLVARQAHLKSDILRIQKELEEEADISEAGGESIAECQTHLVCCISFYVFYFNDVIAVKKKTL